MAKNHNDQVKRFTLYCFDIQKQQYVRLAVIDGEGMLNLIVHLLPHDPLYVFDGVSGKPAIIKSLGPVLLKEVKNTEAQDGYLAKHSRT